MRKYMRKIVAITATLSFLAGASQAQTTDSPVVDHSKMDHAAHMATMADTQRQAEVSRRGKDVMPFDLAATTHVFTKTPEGGVQQVVAKHSRDHTQVQSVRRHLREIRAQFLLGDFSGPSHIHGQDMPGLAELKAAGPGQFRIDYKDIDNGAALTYTTADAGLVAALHQWFDAQLSDHGKDAMQGHAGH
jgi:hypothetical protein